MVLCEAGVVAESHYAKRGGDGALSRSEDGSYEKYLSFHPSPVLENGRERLEYGYNGVGQGEHSQTYRVGMVCLAYPAFIFCPTFVQSRAKVFTPRIAAGRESPGPTQFTRAMDELGVQLIFARSPQAKGRVGRMAGTFQDRLVTELRLAGASTITEAKRALRSFLRSFNERFRVPVREQLTAYRPLDPSVHLDRVFCYKHSRKVGRDNTLKYRWHTLQLAPDAERASYAGARVEVLEGLDGSLRVMHDGRIIPSQEAPPRPGTLRRLNDGVALTPIREHLINGSRARSGQNPMPTEQTNGVRDEVNGVQCTVPIRRKPNRRQRAWWQAIYQAKLRGVSIRGIARDLGMSRNTVRRYLAADGPEMIGSVDRPRALPSDTMRNYTNGHNR